MGWPGWHVPPLGLWNFHQPVKELKSAGKIFIKCPYDFASEVRYTVNVRKFESVTKNVPPLWFCLRYAYDHRCSDIKAFTFWNCLLPITLLWNYEDDIFYKYFLIALIIMVCEELYIFYVLCLNIYWMCSKCPDGIKSIFLVAWSWNEWCDR